ncbi:unnamed protein product [Leptidea sinapis]|uniref:Amino acid permease/ SLC12A domain-containing protein n=1 Tax=Leptidea sinapis TaxID=189913 RepID=A0A5E4QWK3_9NEOP|nr:unnamed protein product [Leptidea sinapis]
MDQHRTRGTDFTAASFQSDEPGFDRARIRRQSGGFVDLGNESQYGTGGHQASGANEIFADVQGDAPWWKSNFFISQPVLFGTWDGVFTSCLINIFGVIVFLRSGWMVGQAGLVNAVLIVIFTVFVALISVLSAVGICERCRIESGGVYFLLAHTLGSRLGGSLGIIYCFGQAVGCALNVFGFGESMASLVGTDNTWAARGFAVSAVILLGTINIAGVKWDYSPSPTDSAMMNGRASNDENPLPPSVHSKNKKWYSHFCNRWLSLAGVAIKLLLMVLVHWVYALGCLSILWLLWLYIGAANPAVKPGRASEFHFFHWLKISFLQAIG